MAQNVASFEQQAHSSYGNQNGAWPQQQQPQQLPQQSRSPQPQYSGSEYSMHTDSAISSEMPNFSSPAVGQTPNFNTPAEMPNFSPFPPVRNSGPNIPPTDEQKELVLEQAREPVLSCQDPDQQLTWAQDALSYCEIAMQNEVRVSRTQAARPRTPRIEHVLKEDALKVTNFLADQNHPKAQFMRGMWYEFGKFGYPVDKPESFQCYKRAADRGYARALYRMGMQFEAGNDPMTALKNYHRAEQLGDSAACYRLGMMTLLGQHGQMQDFQKGLQLIYMAASTADDNAPQGAYVLGMLQAGELTQVSVPEQYLPRDLQSAKANLEKAAFLGFAKAQVRMGAAYELGELGCPFDPALSLHYNALAARQGEVEAEMAISKWFLCGHDGVFQKNEELAFTYAQRAAIDGLATAQFAVGYFYEVGIYVNMDLKEAKDWYRKAEENGNKDAKKRIDAVSRSKTISRKDHERLAVQKIREQHGEAEQNQHQQQPRMPTLPETPTSTIDMPDPSKLSLYNSPQRPPTTAPYPAGPQFGAPQLPEVRPTSAFGINPNLRPLSAATMPISGSGPYPDSYGQPPPRRPYPPGAPQDPYGRRASGPYQGGLAPQPRPQGRPSSASPHISPNLPPQGFSQQHTRPPPAGHTNSAPNVNLGFTAPVDTQGADRPNWTPKASGSGEGPRPGSTHPQSGRDDGYPPRASSGLPSQQGRKPLPSQGYQPPNRANAPSQPRPNQQSSQGRPPANVQPANVKPSQPPANAPIDNQVQSPQKVSASAAVTKPPGKGPKTFAEMGIPETKDDKDCVSLQSCVTKANANIVIDCYVIFVFSSLIPPKEKSECGDFGPAQRDVA